MIGLQKLVLDNEIQVYKLAQEIGIQPPSIYRWFTVNKVPNKYIKSLSKKFNVKEEYINKKVNDIEIHHPKYKSFSDNEYEICGNVTVLFIETKKGVKIEVLIDTEDLPKLIQLNLCWHSYWEPTSEFYYIKTTEYYYDENSKYKAKTIYLHRFVLGVIDSKIHVDHKDNNTLDNRKQNLRQTNHSKNAQNRKSLNKNNTTGHRNVNWGNNKEFYVVQFMKNGERFKWEFSLNQYDEACKFADKKRVELFGEYAGRS